MMQHTHSAIHACRTNATMKDYPGRMAALFFTPGCNFRCAFCHNADLFTEVKCYGWEDLADILKKFKKQWVTAVSITGGEPTIRPELPETVDFLIKRGFSVKLDTNGSNPQMLRELLPKLDYVAMDIKCAFKSYSALTKFHDVEKLRESIRLIRDSGVKYEFRTTVMESFHTDEELCGGAEEIAGAERYFLQAFVPHENLPDEALRTQLRTHKEFLLHAADVVRPFVPNVALRE